MKRSIVSLSLVLVIAAGFGSAQAEEARRYVGETSSTTTTDVGIMTMHRLCQADYPGSFMCSSGDIIRNGRAPGSLLPSGVYGAWVQPTLVSASEDITVDASGISTAQAGHLSCNSWTNTFDGNRGLTLTPNGSIRFEGCDFYPGSELTVACCAAPRTKRK